MIETTDTAIHTIPRPARGERECARCGRAFTPHRRLGRAPIYCGRRCRAWPRGLYVPRSVKGLGDMPPRARETWLAVNAYLAQHPAATLQIACRALGMSTSTYGNAKRMLCGAGVATDDEAFSCEDDDL